MKDSVTIKLDLTKKRYNLLTEANKLVKDNHDAMFCYNDINCRWNVKWRNKRRDGSFLNPLKILRNYLGTLIKKFFLIYSFC